MDTLEFITCPTPGCGFPLTRAHLRLVERWEPQLALVEGTCPRCGSQWGPIALPLSLWYGLRAGEVPEGAPDETEPITADEVLDFHEYLQRLETLPSFASGPALERLHCWMQALMRRGGSPQAMEEWLNWLEARWPHLALRPWLESILQEGVLRLQEAGECWLRRRWPWRGLFGGKSSASQEFRRVVAHQLVLFLLLGVVLAMGGEEEMEVLLASGQEREGEGRNE